MDERANAGGRVYGGKTAAERRAERRARLMEAAMTLFAEHGYHGTSIERLCTRASLNPRNFYQEFPTREALFIALLDDLNDQSTEVARKALAEAPADPGERVRTALSAYIRWNLTDPRRPQIKYVRCVGISEAVELRRQAGIEDFARLARLEFETLADAGLLPRPPDGFALTAAAVMGAANELIMEWILGRWDVPAERVVDEAVHVLVATLTTPR